MHTQFALLVIDVVDSTAVGNRVGDVRMSTWWVAHDRAARDLLRSWRGREIDRSDGFFLLFDLVADALGYARDYHRLLAGLQTPPEPPLKARAGIHVGELLLRANPPPDVAQGAKPLEADGIAKAVAARVMSLARGAQTLLTADARDAWVPDPKRAPSAQLRSHGHWQLKGLSAPLELLEAGDADTVFEPPGDSDKAHRVVQREKRWVPARDIGHSLPSEPDDFIGRAGDLRALAALIDAGAHLVNLHGIGGNGKTRLALHYGWHWLGNFATGVWFCDLSQAHDLDGLLRAVAQGLQVPLGRAEAVTHLGQAIAGRGAGLVILDNFEQVAPLAEATLWTWMRRAPRMRFLVTSREVLRLPGEKVLSLGPLQRTEGVELFRLRAMGAGADPTSWRGPVQKVLEDLVDLLDGLPLAIELAAARSVMLEPSALLERMDQRFRLLTRGRGRTERQATMRATLDWSWDLLSAAERDTLAQLSVFEGGATLSAIESTLSKGSSDGPELIDVLQSLVEKSFVRRASNSRLTMLKTVQDYAAEALASPGRFPGSGPLALQQALQRHWNCFAALGPERAVEDGCADLANLVAATRRAATAGDGAAAVGTLEGAWAALRLRGPFALGVELAKSVAALPGLDTGLRARVDAIAAWALRTSGRVPEAKPCFESALHSARAAADGATEALILALMGDLHVNEGRIDEARAALQHAGVIAERLDARLLLCQIQASLGNLEDYLGHLDEAATRYEQLLSMAQALGHQRWQAGALGNLGLVRDQQGRSAEARTLYETALAAARQIGDRQFEGNNLCNLGLLLHLMGEPAAAQTALAQALQTAREMGHTRLECVTSINLSLVAIAAGDDAAAKPLLDNALTIARELGDRRTQGQVLGNLGALHARQLRPDAARESIELGSALLEEVHDRLSQALLLCDRAEVLQLTGAPASARRAIHAARSAALAIKAGPQSELGHRLAWVERLIAASG